jgi:hypothetical protein
MELMMVLISFREAIHDTNGHEGVMKGPLGRLSV